MKFPLISGFLFFAIIQTFVHAGSFEHKDGKWYLDNNEVKFNDLELVEKTDDSFKFMVEGVETHLIFQVGRGENHRNEMNHYFTKLPSENFKLLSPGQNRIEINSIKEEIRRPFEKFGIHVPIDDVAK